MIAPIQTVRRSIIDPPVNKSPATIWRYATGAADHLKRELAALAVMIANNPAEYPLPTGSMLRPMIARLTRSQTRHRVIIMPFYSLADADGVAYGDHDRNLIIGFVVARITAHGEHVDTRQIGVWDCRKSPINVAGDVR